LQSVENICPFYRSDALGSMCFFVNLENFFNEIFVIIGEPTAMFAPRFNGG